MKVSSRPDSSSWQVAPPATGHWRRRRLLAPARAPSPPRLAPMQAGPSHSPPPTLHPLPPRLAGPPPTPLTAIGRRTHVRQDSADAFPASLLCMLVCWCGADGSTAVLLPMHCNAVQETIAIIWQIETWHIKLQQPPEAEEAAEAGGFEAPPSPSILQCHQPPHTPHDTVCTL